MSRSPDSPGRTRRVGTRLFVLATSCAAALVAAEVFQRVVDPLGTHYYRETNRYFNEAIVLSPGAGHAQGRLFENKARGALVLRDFRFVTDAHGLRAARVDASPPPADAKRILFLGDSVTLGWGVDDEDTWIRTIERESRASDGSPIAALNAGHLRYNTIQEADWLEAHGRDLEPDVVVLTFVVNDFDDAYEQYVRFKEGLVRVAEAGGPGLAARARARLREWFPGLEGLRVHLRERASARTAEERQSERVEELPGYDEGWARCEPALDRVLSLCQRLGVPLVVLDHSTPRIPDVQRWCEERGVPWYDLTFTLAEWELDICNSASDAHANELGNRLLADKALAALRDAGILAPAAPAAEGR